MPASDLARPHIARRAHRALLSAGVVATVAISTAAVAAQSSTLDVVSGATYTSQSYATSLQSALDQASAGGATSSSATPIATSPS